MNRAAHVGLWFAIGGVLLFVGSVLTGPTVACTDVGGDDGGFEFLGFDGLSVNYTPDGGVNTCSMDVTYLIVYVGLALAVVDALLWGSVFLREKRAEELA
jgi:hypothetical protein